MDAKDLRTESSLGEHNDDGRPKYAINSNAIQCDRNKPYQDNGSNSLVKVDIPIARPCAVIGPDRIVPPSIPNEGYLKKTDSEQWASLDGYCRPPEYHHKLPDCQNQTRNISPRQTFQENMQRIMVPPRYNAVKLSDETNFPVDRNSVQSKFHKYIVPPESKYGEVPYVVNSVTNEQKSVKNPEVYVTNPAVLRNSGWTNISANARPSRPYIPTDSYQYPDYGNCAGPKSIPGNRTHRTIHNETGHVYADTYYHPGNIHFKPYPVKERYSQTRYDYTGNYSNPYHQPPPFPNHKYELQKSLPHHPYPGHPQVPLKYLENRLTDPIIESYPRTSNPQPNYNVQLRNPVIHPPFGPIPGNSLHNKAYPFPPDATAKSITSNKLPYDHSKLYMEYDMRNKQYQMSEGFYSNEMSRAYPIKDVVPQTYPPISVHSLSSHPYHRKDLKSYDYFPHFKNMDPAINSNLSRIPSQFSPSGVPISPDSNTSNDITHIQTNSQDDCGYVSQSSTTSIRSVDSTMSRVPNDFHRRYDFRYGPFLKTSPIYSKPDINTHSKEKKDINVRQFLQMWNEGDEEAPENNINQEKVSPMHSNTIKQKEVNSHEQLYVLGLVNVPREELSKYEHIQKVSKLPENIKGYNNIELLNQFEEAIESTNMVNFNMKMKPREVYSTLKTPLSAQQNEITRPLSPLDVEAKISQSIIHKEVGCNFEIKPCSPKMLNVEVAAPVNSIITERIIEKVANPLSIRPSMILPSVDENKNDTNTIQPHDPRVLFNENLKIPSCKMINMQFLPTETSNQAKSNYCLQDLESNSGVCLASLPRLDNDIELNFPEVNQQFINANKIDSEIDITYPKEILNIELNKMVEKEKIYAQVSSEMSCTVSSNVESEKEFVKLSRYRKNKANILECKPNSPKVCNQILRTDSVIIKNPENKQVEENQQLYDNKVVHEIQQNPINLTMQIDDTLKYIDEKVKNNSQAIEFSINSNFNENKETVTREIQGSLFNDEIFVQNKIKNNFPVPLDKAHLKSDAVINNLPEICDSDRVPYNLRNPESNPSESMVQELRKNNILAKTCSDNSHKENKTKKVAIIHEEKDSSTAMEGKCSIDISSSILGCDMNNLPDSRIEHKEVEHCMLDNCFENSPKKANLDINGKNCNQGDIKLLTNTDSITNILTMSLQDNQIGGVHTQELKEPNNLHDKTEITQKEELQNEIVANEDVLNSETLNDNYLDKKVNVNDSCDVLKQPSLKYENHIVVIKDCEVPQSEKCIIRTQEEQDTNITLTVHTTESRLPPFLHDQDKIYSEKICVDQNINTIVEDKHIDPELNKCRTMNAIHDSIIHEHVKDPTLTDSLPINSISNSPHQEIADPVPNFIKSDKYTTHELYEPGIKNHTIGTLATQTQQLHHRVCDTILDTEVLDMANITSKVTKTSMKELSETEKSEQCPTDSPAVNQIPAADVTAVVEAIIVNKDNFVETNTLHKDTEVFNAETYETKNSQESLLNIPTVPKVDITAIMESTSGSVTDTEVFVDTNTVNENQRRDTITENYETQRSQEYLIKICTAVAKVPPVNLMVDMQSISDTANMEVLMETNSTSAAADISKMVNHDTHKFQECHANSHSPTEVVAPVDETADIESVSDMALDSDGFVLKKEMHKDSVNIIAVSNVSYKSQEFLRNSYVEVDATVVMDNVCTAPLKRNSTISKGSDYKFQDDCKSMLSTINSKPAKDTIEKNKVIKSLSQVAKVLVKEKNETYKTDIVHQTSSTIPSCQQLAENGKRNAETGVTYFNLSPFHINKELFSPTIQKLIVHTEGPYNMDRKKNTFVSMIMEKVSLHKLLEPITDYQSVSVFTEKHENTYNKKTNGETSNTVKNIKCMENNTLEKKVNKILCDTVDVGYENHSGSFLCETKAEQNILSINKIQIKTLKELTKEVLSSHIQESQVFECTYLYDKLKNCNDDKIIIKTSKVKETSKAYKQISSTDIEFNENIIEKECHVSMNSDIHRKHNSIQRKTIKRSFSDTELNLCSSDYYDDLRQVSPNSIWPNKRKKKYDKLTHPRLLHENICNIIQSNRRNSVSAIYNEENISFCILIDDNCIITEETDETQNICFTQMLKETVDKIEPLNEDVNENPIKNLSCLEDVSYEYSSSIMLDDIDDKQRDETWVEDVACETIVSDDIAEDIIISMPTSPKSSDLSDDSINDVQTVLNTTINEHTEKVKHIYGDKMRTNEAQLVERLFRTPQMDVKQTLVDIESHIMEGEKCYDKDSLVQILSGSNCSGPSLLDLNIFDDHPCVNSCTINSEMNKSSTFNVIDPNENVKVLRPKGDDKLLQNEYCESKKESKVQRVRVNTGHTYNHRTHNEFVNQYQECPKYSSSSPEVSSTTPEEKNLIIKYAGTNYIHTNLKPIKVVNAIHKNDSCRFNEENNLVHNNNLPSVRPLITKGAQKYIPPIRETIPDLKVKLPLPKNSLKKLKQLKISKDDPKSCIKLTLNTKSKTKNEIYKTKKPKFEDVLKSIDEIQIKMHKEKHKKHRKSIPKVVIKKNENGSHYASTSRQDTYNPDLTGRKWQPWVFLEKNNFLDKMVLKNKTTAIYSHKKKTYVLEENFQKYMSTNSAKFVISQPKSEKCSGQLKCTIRLKHSQ